MRRPRPLTVRLVGAGAALALLGTGLLLWAPWRATGPVDEHGRSLAFVERIVGRGAADVHPETSLPMLVDIHGYGWWPEIHGHMWSGLEQPVRLIVPAGPDRTLVGRSWFPLDADDLAHDIRRSTRALAGLIRHLSATRPTLGTPLVTGYSQGGVLSFALAARHPDVIGAAFPVAGWLPVELIPSRAPVTAAPPVTAFHGADDEPRWCHAAVDALNAKGWNAQAQIFPGVGHFSYGPIKERLIAAVSAALPRG